MGKKELSDDLLPYTSGMESPRKPMRLIVGGLPRTSTVSITSALRLLGFTPYDYFTRLENGHLSQWNRMLQAKLQHRRKPLDKSVVHRLTSNYDCISDAPCFFLVGELAAAFPEAKVLLNQRDVDSWLRSVETTLQPSFQADQQLYYRAARLLDPGFARPIMDCDALVARALCDSDYTNKTKLKERYKEHYRSLKTLEAPRILQYRVQEGWEPLCAFLHLPIPDHPFPRENSAKDLQEAGRLSARRTLYNATRNALLLVLAIILTYKLIFK